MSKPLRVALVVLCLFSLASALWAQSQATTGVIEGTVVDASGASLPGATVTVKNTATNFEQTLTTDRQGRFRALLLPLGPYRVTVSLAASAAVLMRATTTIPLALAGLAAYLMVDKPAARPAMEVE